MQSSRILIDPNGRNSENSVDPEDAENWLRTEGVVLHPAYGVECYYDESLSRYVPLTSPQSARYVPFVHDDRLVQEHELAKIFHFLWQAAGEAHYTLPLALYPRVLSHRNRVQRYRLLLERCAQPTQPGTRGA